MGDGSWTIIAILAIVAIGSHLQADADDGPVKTDEQIEACGLGTLDMLNHFDMCKVCDATT